MTIAVREPDLTSADAVFRPNRPVVLVAFGLFAAGALWIADVAAWGQVVFLALGAALGLVLFHATFGFASSWRALLTEGCGAGLRAQMVMLALASMIFLPLLDQGSLLGRPLAGAVAPVGVSVLCGAFFFGVGMQLGGGCASGTLYTAGSGSPRMVVTLVFFILGSLIGTAHLPWWLSTPSLSPVSLGAELGLFAALGLQLGLFLLIVLASLIWEKRRHGPLSAAVSRPGSLWQRLLAGPWPLLWGAVGLAVLNAATLVLSGHPWTVSFGYALWGAELAEGLGVDVRAWQFWTWPYPRRALEGGVFSETTSVMNFGIILGAFLAAGLAGRFKPLWRVPWPSLLAAALGGLMMGYGARLAFGCNVGAFFSGIASGSLHGWLWFASALAGTYVGLLIRPWFGLAVDGRATRRPRSAERG